MKKVKVVLNKGGVRALLKSPEATQICMEHARATQAAAGPDYEVTEHRYPERNGASVHPANAKGARDNLENNTLLRSLR